MARPIKRTVDYFPHIAVSGKTMFILESRFGNDGYAFWFKLLEMLATTDGHVYDCRNSADWQFLLAKTNHNEEKALNTLNILSELGAIDSELWTYKVIWSDNFVENVADVYKNRKNSVPKKPDADSFYDNKLKQSEVSTIRNSAKTGDGVVSTDKNTQTKLKETKVNKTKLKDTTTSGGEVESQINNAFVAWEKLWLFPNEFQKEDLNHLIATYDDDLVTAAIKLAGSKDVKKGSAISFIEAVIKEWSDNNVKTVEQARDYQKKRNTRNTPYNKMNHLRKESLPDWIDQEVEEQELDEETKRAFEKRLEAIRGGKE